jgi:hypothetical protein
MTPQEFIRKWKPVAQAGAVFESWSDEAWTVDGAAVRAPLVYFEARAILPVQRGEGAMRSMRDEGRRQPDENDRRHHESCEVGAAPHPAFGHLLPAGGEKGARLDSVAVERINVDLSGAGASFATAMSSTQSTHFIDRDKGS